MPNHSRVLLLRAAVTVTSAAAAFASAGAANAHAADDAGSAIVGTVNNLPVNPLAHTTANPLDNSVGSQVADFKPVSTGQVTRPVADSRSVGDLPLVAGVLGRSGRR